MKKNIIYFMLMIFIVGSLWGVEEPQFNLMTNLDNFTEGYYIIGGRIGNETHAGDNHLAPPGASKQTLFAMSNDKDQIPGVEYFVPHSMELDDDEDGLDNFNSITFDNFTHPVIWRIEPVEPSDLHDVNGDGSVMLITGRFTIRSSTTGQFLAHTGKVNYINFLNDRYDPKTHWQIIKLGPANSVPWEIYEGLSWGDEPGEHYYHGGHGFRIMNVYTDNLPGLDEDNMPRRRYLLQRHDLIFPIGRFTVYLHTPRVPSNQRPAHIFELNLFQINKEAAQIPIITMVDGIYPPPEKGHLVGYQVVGEPGDGSQSARDDFTVQVMHSTEDHVVVLYLYEVTVSSGFLVRNDPISIELKLLNEDATDETPLWGKESWGPDIFPTGAGDVFLNLQVKVYHKDDNDRDHALASSGYQMFGLTRSSLASLRKTSLPDPQIENINGGIPLYGGYLVRVIGKAVTGDGFIAGPGVPDFYIVDEDGYGMAIWNPTYLMGEDMPGDAGPIVEGTVYEIIGIVSSYRGKNEILALEINHNPMSIDPVDPFPITLTYTPAFSPAFAYYRNVEDYENRLVELAFTSLELIPSTVAASATLFGDKGGSYPAHTYTNMLANTGTAAGIITIRVMDHVVTAYNLDLTKVKDNVDIIGIVEQHNLDPEAPFNPYSTVGDRPTVPRYRILLTNITDLFEPAAPLHTTLSSFTATFANNNVGLTWVTATESNMMGFHVLRNTSDDLSTAERISENLIRATNSSLTRTYHFTDNYATMGTDYWYWLQMIDNNWGFIHTDPLPVRTENETIGTPAILFTSLNSVFPNPLRLGTSANFSVDVKEGETATLRIFNVRGQLVKEFDALRTGNHRFDWNMRDANNREVSSGVYFYQLISPSVENVRRMLIIR